jgi:hypothetical protein
MLRKPVVVLYSSTVPLTPAIRAVPFEGFQSMQWRDSLVGAAMGVITAGARGCEEHAPGSDSGMAEPIPLASRMIKMADARRLERPVMS